MPYTALLSQAGSTGSAIVGGLGSIYGQYRAGKEARKGRREYRSSMEDILAEMRGDVAGQREDIARYLEPDVHRDYMQTAEAQSVLGGARDQLQQLSQRIRGGVARTGGTTEAALAGQEQATKGYADIMGRLAGHGTQYRQQAQRALMSGLSGWRGAQHGVRQAESGMAENIYGQRMGMAAGHAQAGQNWLEALTNLSGTFN